MQNKKDEPGLEKGKGKGHRKWKEDIIAGQTLRFSMVFFFTWLLSALLHPVTNI